MHSATTIGRTKGRLNISDVGPRFGSTKLAAGAPHIRAFYECVGVCAIRVALALAVLSALLLIAARPAQAQGGTVLYGFTGGSDGDHPYSSLTFDSEGNLYGTTYSGGAFGAGTVFELSPNGSGGWNETVLYSFTGGADGSNPYSNVKFDSLGNLYGTARGGGANGCGVVFELSPTGTSWTETVLYSFCSQGGYADGAYPASGLIFDPAGNLYGTTEVGGANGYGTVFQLSPSEGAWTEQVIYTPGSTSVGGIEDGLALDAAGNIFGVTVYTVFELSPNGNGGWNPTVIYTFNSNSANVLSGTPALDQAGNLYGTTYRFNGGSVYKLSPRKTGGKNRKWMKKTLFSFNGKDGAEPEAGIVFDKAGNIYGTTGYGGEYSGGTVYELVAPVGAGSYQERILWSFNVTDGYWPFDTPILDNAGNLYGTTWGGPEPWNAGVVFEVNPSAAVTATTLTSSPNPSTKGQAVTFTAVVTSSAGAPPDGETVSFMQGKKVLGTGALSGGSASFITSTLKTGATWVTAVYGGDLTFAPSTSNKVYQWVEKAGK